MPLQRVRWSNPGECVRSVLWYENQQRQTHDYFAVKCFALFLIRGSDDSGLASEFAANVCLWVCAGGSSVCSPQIREVRIQDPAISSMVEGILVSCHYQTCWDRIRFTPLWIPGLNNRSTMELSQSTVATRPEEFSPFAFVGIRWLSVVLWIRQK